MRVAGLRWCEVLPVAPAGNRIDILTYFCLSVTCQKQIVIIITKLRVLDLQAKHRELQKQPSRGVLKMCSKFKGEHPCRSVILIKLLWSFIKIALRHGYSPVSLLHIFRTPFLKNTFGRLFLELARSYWKKAKARV